MFIIIPCYLCKYTFYEYKYYLFYDRNFNNINIIFCYSYFTNNKCFTLYFNHTFFLNVRSINSKYLNNKYFNPKFIKDKFSDVFEKEKRL